MTNSANSQQPQSYPFARIEPKWQQQWQQQHVFRTTNPSDESFNQSKPKYYILDMFPYPSGKGLHVGHVEGYTATDIIARYKRMCGHNVLHPMGWDAFGLPAEQYAIKTGQHPRITTAENIANFKKQLNQIGFSYDWQREINTTDSDYVKWTQWIFLQLYQSYFCTEKQCARPIQELIDKGLTQQEIDNQRLAFISEADVNWSPDLGTVLANEEVDEWLAKGFTVEKRPLRQWMLRITAYAERLIDDLNLIDWPNSIKMLQKNWIGKSIGAEVVFAVAKQTEASIKIFTTRADTLFGASYMVLAPEHPLVAKIVTPEQKSAIVQYQQTCQHKSDLERTENATNKTGVFTGAYAINPVNQEKLPIWISDYVLMNYGTGAIMAVPAHDSRDFAFAQTFNLPIKYVVGKAYNTESSCPENAITISKDNQAIAWYQPNSAFTEEGIAINSEWCDGLSTAEAKQKVIAWLENKQLGKKKIQYKLRDWLFSRQRYWGEPFPIVWNDNGEHSSLNADELPLLQPELEDFKPEGDPRGPLAKDKNWIQYSDKLTRETNTMPQWAGSCWYYLRYCDPSNEDQFINPEVASYWANSISKDDAEKGFVDLYVGGTEHAVLHLLYARFWHKVLYDLGHLPTKEPFHKLVNQGIILGENGQKMSKSLGNVVNPEDIITDYGADALRLYEMFLGPLTQSKPWQVNGVEGVFRFLNRLWRTVMIFDNQQWQLQTKVVTGSSKQKEQQQILHQMIQKVTLAIDSMQFNTAIADMMTTVNQIQKWSQIYADDLTTLLSCLSPFAPHIAQEIYHHILPLLSDKEPFICQRKWPTYDAAILVKSSFTLVVQINGKVKAKVEIARELPQEKIEQQALTAVAKHITNQQVQKSIYIAEKLVNFVIKK